MTPVTRMHGTVTTKRKALGLNLALSGPERTLLSDALSIAITSCRESADLMTQRSIPLTAAWFVRHAQMIAELKERVD